MNKNFVILRICGGLGNQMFQYALGKSIVTRKNIILKLDISDYKTYFRPFDLGLFNINYNIASNSDIKKLRGYNNSFFGKIKKLLISKGVINSAKSYYKEKQFCYDEYFYQLDSGYIDGYFQTDKYFKKIRSNILRDFTFPKINDEVNKNIQKNILNTNSVSIHVRRGDYINNSNTNTIHGTCNLNYYKKSIEYIKKNIKNPIFYIFSDDLEWCKDNLSINGVYVEGNDGNNSWKDMKLMSLCQHNIIANSSFSWWGAWLNINNNIVIAPKKWFNNSKNNTKDIIPDNWIKL